MQIKNIFRERILENWWAWLIPVILILSVFYLYPLIEVVRLSFTNAAMGDSHYFYTIRSYLYVFRSLDFWYVIGITFIFVGGSIIFQLLLGLITALLVNKELPGYFFVKLSIISAWVVPGIIAGVIWQILYSEGSWGIINYMIELVGLGKVPFLYSPALALVSVTLTNIWRGSGFSAIMQYAGLRAIPEQLYEAAEIDGASKWQQFRYITLPQLKPILLINIILITIWTFNTYDVVYSLTRGGPGDATTVIALKAYKEVFQYLHLGEGSVYAVIMLFLSLTFTLLYYKLMTSEG